jgi:hypothetical protein
MENQQVVLEVLHFLKNGRFSTSEVIIPEGEK